MLAFFLKTGHSHERKLTYQRIEQSEPRCPGQGRGEPMSDTQTATETARPTPEVAVHSTAADRDVVIDIRKLTKVYLDFWGRRKKEALRALNLQIHRGEVF